jgi:hypothetical protein
MFAMCVGEAAYHPFFPPVFALLSGAFLGFFDPDPGVVLTGCFSTDAFLLFLLLATVCYSITAACLPLVTAVLGAPMFALLVVCSETASISFFSLMSCRRLSN